MNTNDTNTELLENGTAPEEEVTEASNLPDSVPTETAEPLSETTPKEAPAEETEESAPESAAAEPEKKRPRMAFWKKLLIYCSVWIVLTVAACGVMWDMMVQYEEAQPWFAVEEYMETSVHSAFYTALLNAYPDVQNNYEPIYEIARTLSARYSGSLTYSKLIREYTYENPVYLLQSNDQKLLKITLAQGEDTGFLGLRGYEVTGAELVASDLFALRSYGLLFPKGAEVYVNDKKISEELFTEESGFTVFGGKDFSVCMLENFFERPTVKVVYEGKTLPADTDGDFIFDSPEAKLQTMTLSVPENAILRISGKRVSDYFLTETGPSVPDRFGQTVPMNTYVVPTICGEPTFSVTLDGVPLKSEQINDFWSAFPPTVDCTVVIPKNGLLYANGIAVDASLITETDLVWVSAFAGVNNAPLADRYTLTDLYAIPSLTATLGENALTQAKDGENIVFVASPSETLKEQYTKQTIDFMNAYLYYTTQGYSYTRRNLNAAKAHVAYGSPLYKNLESSYIGYYYIAPQQMTVESMTVENFIPYGEDAFTCELSYKINLKNWVGETTEENTMLIAFARGKNTIAPANMLLVEK